MKTTIDNAVNKFLCWKLPEDFHPDGGISFVGIPDKNGYCRERPIGTNLFTAEQAQAMFKDCLVEPAKPSASKPRRHDYAAFKAESGKYAKPLDEREALIANLRACDEGSIFGYAQEAADMLAADDDLYENLQALIKSHDEVTIENARLTELLAADAQEISSVRLKLDKLIKLIYTHPAKAQQVAVPQVPVAWYEFNESVGGWFLAYSFNPLAKTRPLVFGDAAPQPPQGE